MDQVCKSIILTGEFKPEIYHPELLFALGVEDRVPYDQIRRISSNESFADFTINTTNYNVSIRHFTINDNIKSIDFIVEKLHKLFSSIPNTNSFQFRIMNYLHFEFTENGQWTKLSNMLAPKNAWTSFMKNTEKTVGYGISNMSVNLTEQLEKCQLMKILRIEPSLNINSNEGVYVQVDFLFTFKQEQPTLKLIEYATEQAGSRYQEACEIIGSIREMN